MENLKQKVLEAVDLYKSGNFSDCEKLTKKLIESNPKVVLP